MKTKIQKRTVAELLLIFSVLGIFAVTFGSLAAVVIAKFIGA